MYCRMVSSIPGFYLLDASSTSHPTIPSCDNQKCLQTLPNAPGGAKSSSAKNYPLTRRMRQEHQSTEDGVTQSVHLIYYGSTELYSLMKSRKRDENTVWTAIIPNNKQMLIVNTEMKKESTLFQSVSVLVCSHSDSILQC